MLTVETTKKLVQDLGNVVHGVGRIFAG